MRASIPWIGLAFLALVGCDAPAAHADLAGTWTPISTNDCSKNGETIRFTGKRILYSVRGTRRKIADILGVEKTNAGLELRYTARSDRAPSSQPILPMRFLFKSDQPDRLQAVSEAVDGQPLVNINDQELRRVFDLKRCV